MGLTGSNPVTWETERRKAILKYLNTYKMILLVRNQPCEL